AASDVYKRQPQQSSKNDGSDLQTTPSARTAISSGNAAQILPPAADSREIVPKQTSPSQKETPHAQNELGLAL
ncbi:MAG: hypothetical protein N2Z21_09795, partial [Candidatus Sumerlaeaceae bacterium]|nr:hypothetical protein [Candidatus Sumerlaeaceae bacterium]